jgi:hypothetical protein
VQIRDAADGVISIETIDANEELKQNIGRYLALMERLAVGINSDIFDIEIFDKMAGHSVIHTCEQLREYIKASRQYGNAKKHLEFEIMVEALRELRKGE